MLRGSRSIRRTRDPLLPEPGEIIGPGLIGCMATAHWVLLRPLRGKIRREMIKESPSDGVVWNHSALPFLHSYQSQFLKQCLVQAITISNKERMEEAIIVCLRLSAALMPPADVSVPFFVVQLLLVGSNRAYVFLHCCTLCPYSRYIQQYYGQPYGQPQYGQPGRTFFFLSRRPFFISHFTPSPVWLHLDSIPALSSAAAARYCAEAGRGGRCRRVLGMVSSILSMSICQLFTDIFCAVLPRYVYKYDFMAELLP